MLKHAYLAMLLLDLVQPPTAEPQGSALLFRPSRQQVED